MASHTVLRQELTEMGFESELIDKALKELGEKATIESVIESIELSQNGGSVVNPNETKDMESVVNPNETKDMESVVEQKSNDTNRDLDIESKQRLYEEKIKQRRLEREEKEKEEELKREIKRRQDGKGIGKLKEELQQLERKRLAEEMRREKAEQKAQKEAILEQIAADRQERRNRAFVNTSVPAPAPVAAQTVSKEGKCRLAIRLLDGKQLIHEFDSRESLSSVRVFVITQACVEGDISFVMPPLPSFTEEDMQKPLNVLGLCPSARVHVIKR